MPPTASPGPATAPLHKAADTAAQYAAAHAGAVAIWRNQEGRVRGLDRDRLDLLHRMSTNDLNGLPVGEARQTVLTTPIARIGVEVPVLAVRADSGWKDLKSMVEAAKKSI